MTLEFFLQSESLQSAIIQCCNIDMQDFCQSGLLNKEDTLIVAIDWYYGMLTRLMDEETDG